MVKKCPNCGRKVEGDWEFCPWCGYDLGTEDFNERINKLIKDSFNIFDFSIMDMDKEIEKFLKSKPVKGGSLSITFQSGTGMEPKIEIKTSGEFKKLEPEIKKQLGLEEKVKEISSFRGEREKTAKKEESIEKVHAAKPAERPTPKVTEEPVTQMVQKGRKRKIIINLEGVKSLDDIDIRRIGNSLEIKAFAGDKVYFKVLPFEGEIVSTKFKDSTLVIDAVE